MLFHLSFLLWNYLRQENKGVCFSSMSTKMEVPLQSELTECLVNARHWPLCMGANLIGDMRWGLREPQSCWRYMPITNSISYVVCSVQFSRSVMSSSLQPHGLQHARLPCPSPTSRACSNPYPLSQWCHPTISSCRLLLLLSQSFPASGSFPMSQLFASGDQRIGASASASLLPVILQDEFPLGLTSLILQRRQWHPTPVLWPPNAKSQLIEKDPDSVKDWRQEEKGMREDEIVGWHHWLNGHEFEKTPGDNEEQGRLACRSPWDHKELGMTEWLNNN